MTKFDKVPKVERIKIKLSDAKKDDLMKWIFDMRSSIATSRSAFMQRHQKYLTNFDDFITYNRKGPWDGASNLHLPLTAIMVQNYQARLYNIFTQTDATQFVPRETMDLDHVCMLKKLRNWYMWDYLNRFKGIRGVAREVFYDTVTVGFGVILKTWQKKQRKAVEVVENELYREMNDMAPQIKELNRSEDIDEVESEGKIDISPYKEVTKIVNVFEGTKIISVPFENIYFPNNIPGSNDLDHPALVSVDTPIHCSDIKLKVYQGLWDKEAAEMAMDIKKSGYSSDTKNSTLKEQRDYLTGYNSSLSSYHDEERCLSYDFISYDIDDDGVNEDLIVERIDNQILSVDYLDRISRTGSRPIFKFDCFLKSRQAYSRGIPEFMYPLQEEVDQHHNMQINALSLQSMPWGTYRSSSSLKNQPIAIRPGKFIPTDEPATDIAVKSFPLTGQIFQGLEDKAWRYAELLGGSSSLEMGITPDVVGATRSTSGIVALLKQMDKRMKPSFDANADTWKMLETSIIDDLDNKISLELKMKVLGASVDDYIMTREELGENLANQVLMVSGSLDVKIDVASISSSDEIIRNEAQIILDRLTVPSILQQLGIVGPEALHKAISDWIRAYNKDPEDYGIQKPIYSSHPLTLFQEIQVCGQGMLPPMSLRDDHNTKAQLLIQFLKDPHYVQAKSMGLYVENVDEFVMNAANKHAQMAQMLTPQGVNMTGGGNQNITQIQSGTAPQQMQQNQGVNNEPR